MKYNFFPYSFVVAPKMRNKHALVPVFSAEDMYEINVLFRNRKSYFDLKPNNIFLRHWFMTHNLKIRQI